MKKEERYEREELCAALRDDGLWYSEIAEEVGYFDKSGARKAVQRFRERNGE